MEEHIELIIGIDLVQYQITAQFHQTIAKSDKPQPMPYRRTRMHDFIDRAAAALGCAPKHVFLVPLMMGLAFVYGLVTEKDLPRAMKWTLVAFIMSIGFVIACLGNEQTDARLLAGEGIMLLGAFIVFLRFTPPRKQKTTRAKQRPVDDSTESASSQQSGSLNL